MKTFYTLLLAFGLCLTSHAQSNVLLCESYITDSGLNFNSLFNTNEQFSENDIQIVSIEDINFQLGNIQNKDLIKILVINVKEQDVPTLNLVEFTNLQKIAFILYDTNEFQNNYLNYNFNNIDKKILVKIKPD